MLRLAVREDIERLDELIELSARTLQAGDYSDDLIQAALGPIFAVDQMLIDDGTYFVAESNGKIVGCGGWSRRRRPFGGGGGGGGDELLNPAVDAAHIRAFFVHPSFARRGIGSAIMKVSEEAAREAGFRRLELVATLTGISLYERFGFSILDHFEVPAGPRHRMPVARMVKSI